jgi:hypothetical protein
MSPAETLTSWVLLPAVSVSEMVTAREVDTPFLYSVNVLLFPDPGAVVRLEYIFLKVPATGITADFIASVALPPLVPAGK